MDFKKRMYDVNMTGMRMVGKGCKVLDDEDKVEDEEDDDLETEVRHCKV